MKKNLLITGILLAAGIVASSCDDASSGSPVKEPAASCTECKDGETCDNGSCKCGGEVCKADQVCTDGKCADKEDNPCEDDNCDDKTVDCNDSCKDGETCDNGTCKCGGEVCNAEQVCTGGKCVKKDDEPCEGSDCETPCEGTDCETPCEGTDCETPCEGTDCEPPCEGTDCEPPCEGADCEKTDACNNACKNGETCDNGTCKCGEEVCTAEQVCSEGKCEKEEDECTGDNCVTEPVCEPACKSGEVCVEAVCKCGNGDACQEGLVCIGGVCQEDTDNADGDMEEEDICDPECTEGHICESGECIPYIPPKSCDEECSEGKFCNPETGACEPLTYECVACETGEVCDTNDGICKCGGAVCGADEKCSAGKCIPIDPCATVSCTGGNVCDNGKCVELSVKFENSAYDVLLSSKKVITASRTSTSKLTWTLDGAKASEEMSGLRCIKSDGHYSRKLSECIIVDSAKKTETVTMIGLSRKGSVKTLKVKDSNGKTAETTLTLKPYFGMDSFVNVNEASAPVNLRYRNNLCPGPKLSSKSHTVAKASYTYTDNSETEQEQYANLCGSGNTHCRTKFNEDQLAVFDKDMHKKFVQPKMLNGHGTRASVVAAARFLVLQFPYDIPYAMGGVTQKSGRGHYVWTDNKSPDSGTAQSKKAVYGLNLTTNVYDVSHKSLRNNSVPWGAVDSSLPLKDKAGNYINNPDFNFSGQECSGYVNWALRNGRFGFGDWTTKVFAKNGFCKNKSGDIQRNYLCRDVVENTVADSRKDLRGNSWGNITNRNNALDKTYQKMAKLVESKDFKRLDGQTLETVKKALKDAKAGDLLWRGIYISKKNDTYENGHVAMILGLERDSNGDVTKIYIGEAVKKAGNTLTQLSVNGFMKSNWVGQEKDKYNYASYLIKMDNVYNYYDSTTVNPNDDKLKATNPCKGRKGGNCYKYSEMFNKTFTEVIK